MSEKVAIIDYKIGNLFSVKQAFEKVGFHAEITSDNQSILSSDILVLPGVGAFGEGINNLRNLNLIQTINKFIESNRPFIGVCLGMQLMMTESDEFGNNMGLNIIQGKVKKFNSEIHEVPQIQWNKIYISRKLENKKLFNAISNESYMYFVHSFYCVPEDSNTILATTNYGGTKYPSIIKKNNCIGIQFHPEKSGPKGLTLYENLKNFI